MMMGLPDREPNDARDQCSTHCDDRANGADQAKPHACSTSWLAEIVEALGHDPAECWLAIEALATVDPRARPSLVEELAGYSSNTGVHTLLRLLSTARDPDTRQAARRFVPEPFNDRPASLGYSGSACRFSGPNSRVAAIALVPSYATSHRRDGAARASEPWRTRVIDALVTPVNGQGRGFVVISTRVAGQRRTAAFCCDVSRGIVEVAGDIEPEADSAGTLLDEFRQAYGGARGSDVEELALGLLSGSLMLSGPGVPAVVRDWLDGMLGSEFEPRPLPAVFPGLEIEPLPADEVLRRANDVLDACPSWLDGSSLTFELAEEISLRERRAEALPERDAGAYRYLFEHLLIHRLELYRRMLFWMAWLWHRSSHIELARSAFVLASELSDEQYSVPSHPFTVALTTRSLEAAQARLRTAAGQGRTGPQSP
jgi:hypothetical protein